MQGPFDARAFLYINKCPLFLKVLIVLSVMISLKNLEISDMYFV